jgi:hypothetical protein
MLAYCMRRIGILIGAGLETGRFEFKSQPLQLGLVEVLIHRCPNLVSHPSWIEE